MAMGRIRSTGALQRRSPDAAQAVHDQGVGPLLYPRGHLGVRGSAVRRIVLEAAKARWIVRGGDDNTVRQPTRAATVVAKNRMRDYWRRRVPALGIDHHLDAVGRQYLQGGLQRRPRKRVG